MDTSLVDTINQEDNTLTTCTYVRHLIQSSNRCCLGSIDQTIAPCRYLPPPGVCDDSVEAPVCSNGSDSFEGADLQGWQSIDTIGSNDVSPRTNLP